MKEALHAFVEVMGRTAVLQFVLVQWAIRLSATKQMQSGFEMKQLDTNKRFSGSF